MNKNITIHTLGYFTVEISKTVDNPDYAIKYMNKRVLTLELFELKKLRNLIDFIIVLSA